MACRSARASTSPSSAASPTTAGCCSRWASSAAGSPLDVIAQNFSNSPEFTTRYGSLTNDQYINLVYQNVLGRAPDPDGYNFYFTRLQNGTMTRGQMMIGFSESPEFQQLTSDEVFGRVGLRRACCAGPPSKRGSISISTTSKAARHAAR